MIEEPVNLPPGDRPPTLLRSRLTRKQLAGVV
jgi:hypothetical protein